MRVTLKAADRWNWTRRGPTPGNAAAVRIAIWRVRDPRLSHHACFVGAISWATVTSVDRVVGRNMLTVSRDAGSWRLLNRRRAPLAWSRSAEATTSTTTIRIAWRRWRSGVARGIYGRACKREADRRRVRERARAAAFGESKQTGWARSSAAVSVKRRRRPPCWIPTSRASLRRRIS